MQKIKNFFLPIAAKIGGLLKIIKDKIFWKKAEQVRQEKLKDKLIFIIVGIVIIILVGWLAATKLWPKSAENGDAAQAIARAEITIVTSRACGSKCWDTQLFIDALAKQGIKVEAKRTVYVGGWWPWGGGNDIAKQFQISKVPTVIVEFTGGDQPDINKFFSPALGSVIGGKFVLTKILAPYFDLNDKKLKGDIKVTYLTDKSCNECYDVTKHENALKNLGAFAADSETIDVSSAAGQALVNKYKITKVPTVLVSGEVSEYTILTQAWAQVGIVAQDGTYIFTNLDLMGDSYRDLTTGKIIKAKPPATAPAAPAVK